MYWATAQISVVAHARPRMLSSVSLTLHPSNESELAKRAVRPRFSDDVERATCVSSQRPELVYLNYKRLVIVDILAVEEHEVACAFAEDSICVVQRVVRISYTVGWLDPARPFEGVEGSVVHWTTVCCGVEDVCHHI